MSNSIAFDLPDLKTLVQQLIAKPSVSSVLPEYDSSNQSVVELLDMWFRTAGFKTEIQAIAGYPGKYNLIAVKGQGDNGLVLAGHTDTVPFDEQLWQQNPFQLTERDQRWYGLGTSDMKSFFALILEALREMDTQQLKAPLIVLATADEESSMCGARALLDSGKPRARYAVIGEPTGLKPIRMHKGVLMERIAVIGKTGHASDPALGHNAIDGVLKVLQALQQLREQLAKQYQHPGFEVTTPTLNFGHIHGGDNPNRICGHCALDIDVRLLPGMAIDETRALIYQHATLALENTPFTIHCEPLFEGLPAMETSADSALVKAVEQLTGHDAMSVAFGTEAPYFQQMGMDVVILGPGDIAVAHQPNEYLRLQNLNPCIDQLRQLIQRFCIGT
ncbi:MAG: acetylornithine deacetylase [Gammaproteobacteria bacterium]|nr:acetylornithine deacetylase [Gammaproteobacteria bacterium]